MAKTPRTWSGARTPSGLKRVRQAARRHDVLGPRRTAAKTFVAKALTLAASPVEGSDPAVALTDALSASLIRRKGNVVNISSVSSFSGALGQIAYAASKGAVNSFTRNASIDLGRSGVRVNAVAPGVIDDGMWSTAFAKGLDREKTLERMGRLVPLEKRWGTAQEIADAVAFLASDKAAYITGQVLRVDGGMIV